MSGCYFYLQEDRISATGDEAEKREAIVSAHACFFIQNVSHRNEHVRDISINLLSQLRNRFPQVDIDLLVDSLVFVNLNLLKMLHLG